MPSILRNKAFILTLMLVVYLAADFWITSRYPGLDQKAMMAGTAGIEPLGFDTVLVINADDPIYTKILKGTVNWGKTNQRGMIFGILFGAALLTMISLFKRKSFEGALANSVLGVLIGTPLGVCVNCAAPIAKGLHSAGLRLETTLAAMISSPTLNVIVLTMVFALLPLYMAVLKVGATFLVLLVLIPLLSKYFFKTEVSLTAQRALVNAAGSDAKFMALDAPVPEDNEIATWLKAFIWLLKAFPRNLWFIIKTTLPLMVLAGFLGALAVNVVPIDALANLLPTSSTLMILAGLLLAAFIGVFMPVPITFDVIIVTVLMASGMPVMYAMVLLFTLGTYSVYSYMIVAQAISKKVGVTLWITIALVGVGTGVVAHKYGQWLEGKQQAFMLERWANLGGIVEYNPEQALDGAPAADILPRLAAQAVQPEPVNSITASDGITVAATALRVPVATGDKLFSRATGAEVGIDQPYQFSLLRWTQPFSEFGGIASGDVHNDGWPDVVVSSQSGAYLYANVGGKFEQQELEIPGLHDKFIANVALVDLDNDGWLDLVYSAYRDGTYVVYNDKGMFTDARRIKLPNKPAAWLSAAVGFGDLDEDGRLDIVLGNWTLGSALSKNNLGRESSRNVVLMNRPDGFEPFELAGPDGETLTVLLSDWNNDGHLDLIVGNDFAVPDLYYLGDGKGNLKLLTADDEIIPVSALLTMSATAADINNDLLPEIYIGNVSGTDRSVMARIPEMCVDTEGTSLNDQCLEVRANQDLMNRSLSKNDPLMCTEFSDSVLVEQCVGMHLNLRSWWQNNPEYCRMLQGKLPELSLICEEYFSRTDKPIKGEFKNEIPQGARRANVLLMPDGKGAFVDQALEFGLREAGWVWNAKFADLDQDGWQDIYIANGYFNENMQPARESNAYFRNNEGKKFVDETKSQSMQMFAETAAYTYVDIDKDSDLDLVVREVAGPVWVYTNNTTAGKAIAFDLEDQRGNRSGIGAKVIIHYDGKAQMRELQASGGFSSFDAPVAHFGLGKYDSIERVEIKWPNGETTEMQGDFKAGNQYRISRN